MVIALLTDFGTSDPYVGMMKGVIAKIAPSAQVMDLAHDLPSFDVTHAAFVLGHSYLYFPRGTIFIAVVDPGVGGARRPILVETENYFFIGPDNGVFTLVLEEQKVRRIIHLNNSKYFLHPVSQTFHGRDLFAPVAAHLSQGITLDNFGPDLKDYHRLHDLAQSIRGKEIIGKVVVIDRFGNAITNLKRSFLEKYFPKMDFSLSVGARRAVPLQGIHTHYAEGKPKQPMLLFGSSHLLEIAINQGSAADRLKLKPGDAVKIPLKL